VKLESHGILISMRAFGAADAIAHIFTQDFGVMTGMLKGAAVAKKNRPLVGQIGAVSDRKSVV
jgi:recombinational DNA repair protein (RecF pathway)